MDPFTLLSVVTLPLVAAMIAYGLSPLAGWLAVQVGAIDLPSDRKVHSVPIPRLGGLAVLGAAAIVLVAATYSGVLSLPRPISIGVLAGLLPILVVSIADDISSVRPGWKLTFHLTGSAAAVALGVSLDHEIRLFGATLDIGWLAAPLSVLWLVGVTNAFNVMDGLDGLSAGLSLISSIAMAGVFMLAREPMMALAAMVIAGALAGFLPFNLHPARMFLGDCGSTALGFCLAAFALKGGATLSSGFAVALPMFVLGLPITETFITIARRSIGRFRTQSGSVFEPDRNHVHHRLLALGFGHTRAVLILHVAGAMFAGVGFLSMLLSARQAALFLTAVAAAAIIGIQRLRYEEFSSDPTGLIGPKRPLMKKALFAVVVDISIVVISVYVAIGLKTDDWLLRVSADTLTDMAATLAPLYVFSFWRFGLYRGSWRFATFRDLYKAAQAIAVVSIGGALANHVLWTPAHATSIFAIYGMVSFVLAMASRFVYVLVWRNKPSSIRRAGRRAILYGAGRRGVAVARELTANPVDRLIPIAFVDDAGERVGTVIEGLPVIGSSDDLVANLSLLEIDAVIVSTPRIPATKIAFIAIHCAQHQVAFLRWTVVLQPVPAVANSEEVDSPSKPRSCDSCSVDSGTTKP